MRYLRKITWKRRLPKVNTNLDIKRGYLYYADLSPVVGSEQGGVRPVLIIQNDIGNKYSPTVIVAAITSQINKANRAQVKFHQTTGVRSYPVHCGNLVSQTCGCGCARCMFALLKGVFGLLPCSVGI